MSRMGESIVGAMDIVNRSKTFEEAESLIRNQYGDMFVAIAEEYYKDQKQTDIDYSEAYDTEGYEQLLRELEEAGVL